MFVVFFTASQAQSFDKRGKISGEVSYYNIKVYQPSKYSIKVCGYLKNNTEHKIFISADLIFQRVTKTKINWGRVVENIKPNSSIFFDVYLERKDNFRHTKEALHLKWDVDDLNVYKPYKKTSKAKYKSTSRPKNKTTIVENRSTVREGRKTIYINGSGRQTTEEFTLEPGKHNIKISYDGTSNFIVRLIDQFGNSKKRLANEIGSYENRLVFFIKNQGRYLLDVDSSGKWSFEIKRPASFIKSGHQEAEEQTSVPLKGNKYKIIFNDGSVMKAQNYWEQDNDIVLEMYGAQVFFNKTKIKEIKELGAE